MSNKGIRQKHYWNTLDVVITESAAATLTEVAFPTGVSPSSGFIMLIKRIVCSINGFDLNAILAPGAQDAFIAALSTRQDLTTIPGLQDDGTIWYHAPVHEAGGDGATAAENPGSLLYIGGFPSYVEFDDPLPVADDEISLYIEGIGLTTAVVMGLKIWYRVEKVSFQDALMVLESYR